MDAPIPTQQLPVTPPQKSSSRTPLFVGAFTLLVVAIGYMGYQNWLLKQQVSRLDKLIQVDNAPFPFSSPTSSSSEESSTAGDPTAKWKTYMDPSGEYSFKYPAGYVLSKLGDSLPLINRKIYWSTLSTSSLNCKGDCPIIDSTSKVIVNRVEATKIKGWIGEIGGNYAQSYIAYEIKYPTQDKYLKITLWELPQDIKSEEIPSPNRKVGEINRQEEDTFDQILSTFKFFDKGSSIPVSTTNLKKLTYYLPTGWRTVQDKTGSFEIGYDPSISKVSEPIEENTASIYRTDRILGSFITVRLLPYSGESRHQFLYAQIGEKPVNEDLLPTYHESEYSYNGKSCLFLVGIAISQYPTTWGMCDAGNKKAFLVTSYDDNVYEKFVQTIRLMK